jgi:hypothetical protein
MLPIRLQYHSGSFPCLEQIQSLIAYPLIRRRIPRQSPANPKYHYLIKPAIAKLSVCGYYFSRSRGSHISTVNAPAQNPPQSNTSGGGGCVIVFIVIVAGCVAAWVTISTGTEDWLPTFVAKSHLIETCGTTQEIISVVEVNDTPSKGYKQGIYEFKKRPLPGEVVSGETFRGNASFIWNKDKWAAVCGY